MADVTGRIGNEEVELNNAATEATLKMLLQASLAAAKGSKEELNKIAAMAAKAGLDSDSIIQANNAVQATTPQMNALGKTAFFLGATFGQVEDQLKTIWQTGQLLASGNAQASQVLTNMATMLPGPIAALAKGLSSLAAFQEGMLTQYQTLTKAGVNFGGSLTQLRLAASQTYMTMEQFTQLVSTNSDTLSRMGGTVDQGARSFVTLSNSLLKSAEGTGLRALGYTTAEVNQGMLDYINITGGRNKKELQNTAEITKGTTEYLSQLDELAQITGKTKEQQAQALKEANQNAAIQAKLAGMDEKQKLAYNRGLAEMEAKFGKAGREMYQAQVLGIPPMTEAAQKLTALAPEVSKASQGMADVAKRGGTAAETMQYSAKATEGAVKASERFGNVTGAMSFQGGVLAETMMNLTKTSTQASQQGRETASKELEARAKVIEEQKKRQESEAAAAVKTQQTLQEIGQKLLAAFMPVVEVGLKIVNAIAPLAPYIMGVIAVFATLKASIIAYDLAMKARAAIAAGGGGAGGVLNAGMDRLRGGGGATGGAAGSAGGAAGGAASGGLSALGPALRSAAAGLRAFANPMVMAGALGFGVAIAAIGAGIAGAAWLVGKALPTLAEGLMKFTEIDGAKLGASAFGIAKLGLGLLPFAPMAIWGLPVGLALNMMGDGLLKIASVDPAKLERVAAGMEKVKAATPSVGETIRAGVAGLVAKVTGPSESSADAKKPAAASQNAELINLIAEMRRLNTLSSETLKYIKETADYTKRTVDAVKELNGDLFK
jgi:hypothetical protein